MRFLGRKHPLHLPSREAATTTLLVTVRTNRRQNGFLARYLGAQRIVSGRLAAAWWPPGRRRHPPMRIRVKGCDPVAPVGARESVPQGHLIVAHYEVVGKALEMTPSRRDDRTLSPWPSYGQAADRSSLAGRVAFEKHNPPLRSWATIKWSLRDEILSECYSAFKLTRMSGCRTHPPRQGPICTIPQSAIRNPHFLPSLPQFFCQIQCSQIS